MLRKGMSCLRLPLVTHRLSRPEPVETSTNRSLRGLWSVPDPRTRQRSKRIFSCSARFGCAISPSAQQPSLGYFQAPGQVQKGGTPYTAQVGGPYIPRFCWMNSCWMYCMRLVLEGVQPGKRRHRTGLRFRLLSHFVTPSVPRTATFF